MKTFYAAAAIAISMSASPAHSATAQPLGVGYLDSSHTLYLLTSVPALLEQVPPTYEQDGYIWFDQVLEFFPILNDQFELTFLSANASAFDNRVIKFSTEIVETGAPSAYAQVSKPAATISYEFGPGITSHENASSTSIDLPAGMSKMTLRLADYTPGSYVYTCSEPVPFCFPGNILTDRGALLVRFSVGTPSPVPEPTSLALMATGLALLSLTRKLAQ